MLAVLLAASSSSAALLHATATKTFSSVLKGAIVPAKGGEVLCFELNATGWVNHLWFTGPAHVRGVAPRLRVYVDGEQVPSIDAPVDEGLTSSAPETDGAAPWGTRLHGRSAHRGGGFWNTRRIPFGSRLRVTAFFATPLRHGTATARQPDGVGDGAIMRGAAKIDSFFFIIRGLEVVDSSSFAGISVAGLQLPPTARLKLYSTEATSLKLLQYLTIANVRSKRTRACMRAHALNTHST